MILGDSAYLTFYQRPRRFVDCYTLESSHSRAFGLFPALLLRSCLLESNQYILKTNGSRYMRKKNNKKSRFKWIDMFGFGERQINRGRSWNGRNRPLLCPNQLSLWTSNTVSFLHSHSNIQAQILHHSFDFKLASRKFNFFIQMFLFLL